MNEQITNVMWNVVLIGVLGFMIRLWMKDIKDAMAKDCLLNRQAHEKFDVAIIKHLERIVRLEAKLEGK
jgi:hypothetical protein